MFHVCGRRGEKYSFLCPAGTIFNQNYLTCDFWYNSDCSQAESLYGINDRNQAEGNSLASYGSDGQSLDGYQSDDLASYSGDNTQPPNVQQTLSRVNYDKYGRDAKSLELQDSVFITTPPPDTAAEEDDILYDDYEDDELLEPQPPVFKRQSQILRPQRRRTKKYSWRNFLTA